MFLRTGDGAQAVYWEYAGSRAASASASYLDTLTTPSTRAPGWMPYTVVMVQARAATGTAHWESWADSAVAIDNVGPSAPSPFAGNYVSGTTTMTWGAHPATDFAAFRLYRGDDAGFVPGPSNLVAETAATGWVDVAGRPYCYKLTGVDVHGAEGPASVLLPSGTSDTSPGTPVTALRLAPISPNPASGPLEVRIELPEASVT